MKVMDFNLKTLYGNFILKIVVGAYGMLPVTPGEYGRHRLSHRAVL